MSYYIKQIGSKDCAYASLKMLLAIVYKSKKFLYYPQPNKDEAYSLQQIIDIAYLEGVEITAYRLKNKESFFSYKPKYPLLVPIKQNNMLHMVLIKKIKKRKVLVYDPKIGIYWLNKAEFLDLWNGEILEVDRVTKSTFTIKTKSPIPIKYRILSSIFQFLSISFLLSAMFFINNEITIYIPILLIIGFIISEFAYKKILIMSMKYFDKYVAYQMFDGDNRKFKEKYQEMSTFKLLTISFPIQLINAIVAFIAGIIILGINSYFNVINVILISIFRLLLDTLELKLFINKERNVSFGEEELFKIANEKRSIVTDILEVQNKAYKQANFISLKKNLVILLTCTLAILYCVLSNEITLNFLMFHGFAYYYLSENASKILNVYFKGPEYRQSKCLYEFYCREL